MGTLGIFVAGALLQKIHIDYHSKVTIKKGLATSLLALFFILCPNFVLDIMLFRS
jgi:hypothetical protein